MFQKAKDAYREQREAERQKLIAYLQKHTLFNSAGLKVVTGGASGNGSQNYTSTGRIAPCDMRNWKWVECKNRDDTFQAVISLNMPDNDLNSGNPHSLYDRVGVLLTYKRRNDSYKTSIWTDIDLPFNDESLGRIADLMIEQLGIYSWLAH